MRSLWFCLLLLTVLSLGCSSPAEVEWLSFQSPSKSHKLRVTYLEAWAYSPHEIRFYSKKKLLTTKQLRNDGANLSNHNIELVWLGEESVEVTLKGEEQQPESFLLSF